MTTHKSFKLAAENDILYFFVKGKNIKYASDKFSEEYDFENKPYKELFRGLDLKKEVQILNINGITHLFTMKKVIVENEKYTLVSINKEIGVLSKSSNISIGIVHIDNYDEISSKLTSEQLSFKLAILHKKLALLANNYNFLLLNISNGDYIFLLDSINLALLKTEKFSFVNEIKNINLGIDTQFTLSIGISDGNTSLTESYEIAKNALEFAISRGGDQVALKDQNKYTFYGGEADTSTHFNKVRSRIKAKLLKELYENSSNILIMGHKNPDLDSLGSALGLAYLAKKMNIQCNIVLDEPNRAFERMMSMLNDESYKNMFVDKKTALEICQEDTSLIVVDVHKSSLTEYPELVDNKTKKIAVFDHHRRGLEYIHSPILEYHESSSSSTCELITDMLTTLPEVKTIPPNIADALLAGITLDTKWFTFKVSARTFECASNLQKFGANTINIHKMLQNNFEEYKLKYNLISTAEVFYDKIAIAVQEDFIENQNIIVSQACDELLTFVGIEVSFVLSYNADFIHISARSQGEINVQIIMEYFGGGGHKTMAACRIYNSSIDEVKLNLLNYMKKYFK